jgi:hypothetical protein
MYVIFIGNSDKMPLQVMMSQTAVVASVYLLASASSGSPLGLKWGRKMRDDDYLVEGNAM